MSKCPKCGDKLRASVACETYYECGTFQILSDGEWRYGEKCVERQLAAANAKLAEMARLAEDTQREVKTLTQDLVAANLTIDHMRRGMPQAQVKETDDA